MRSTAEFVFVADQLPEKKNLILGFIKETLSFFIKSNTKLSSLSLTFGIILGTLDT